MFLLLIFGISVFPNSPTITDVKVGGIYSDLQACQSHKNMYSGNQAVCVKVES